MTFNFGPMMMALTDAALFGEVIIYGKSTGVERTIQACVNRNPLTPVPEAETTQRPVFEITVMDDAALGIAISELDIGTDYLKFSRRLGQTAETFQITRSLDQANGLLKLEI